MPETAEERAHRKRRGREDYAARWMAENELPACECGCGEQVRFGVTKGRPNRYVRNHQRRDPSGLIAYKKTLTAQGIPIEDFRRALRQVKDTKGWTWAEMANQAGIPAGTLHSMMYGPGQHSVSRQRARDVFARLAGKPMPMTPLQRRQQMRAGHREAQIRAELAWEVPPMEETG